MRLSVYLGSAAVLLVIAWVVFRVIVRRDYRKHQRLRPVASLIQFSLWVVYMLVFPSLYNPPYWMSVWVDDGRVDPIMRIVALVLIAIGVAGALGTMAYLGFRRAVGRQVDVLKQTGPYRVTRNPGLFASLPMIVGAVIRWPSWYALGWLCLFAAMIHMMILSEEEHLRDRFGEEYRRYCERVPRYL